MSSPTEKMIAAAAYYMTTDQNKSAAYRHAYNTENMSDRSIHTEAHHLFQHPAVKTMIDTWQKQAADRVQVNVAWVLRRATLLADFNINKFLYTDEAGGAFYDFSRATDDDWYCISEYCVDVVQKGQGMDKYEAERIKIKSEAKLKALEMVAKLGGLPGYNNKVEIEGSLAVLNLSTDEYLAARERVIEHDDC